MSEANPLARHGGVSYLEIPARDVPQSADFYERVFGWQIDRRANGDFRFSDGRMLLIGAFTTNRSAPREPGIVPFIYVDDIDSAVARARESGGEVVKAIYPEGDLRVARVRDPAGNEVGLWQFNAK